MARTDGPTVLIAGASRGLGLALVTEFAKRDWSVIGTVRGTAHTPLHDLAERLPSAVRIVSLDITKGTEIEALRTRFAKERIDFLFVNAGTTTTDPLAEIGAVSDQEFERVMRTNALGPMRVIEAFQDLVPSDGMIGAMTSGQGSIANNERGQREVYRASKAALNMLVKSFAARQTNSERSIVVLAPGWIQTDLGGEQAPFTVDETVPAMVDVLLAKRLRPGIEYLDRFGATVPW